MHVLIAAIIDQLTTLPFLKRTLRGQQNTTKVERTNSLAALVKYFLDPIL